MKPFSGVKIALICDGQIITIQRDDKPDLRFAGMWDLPGGGRDDDETPIETVKREVFEELGITLQEDSIVYQKEYPAMIETSTLAYFMAAQISKAQVDSIVFGNEGQGWKSINVEDFLAHDNIVPFLSGRLTDLTSHPISKDLGLLS